MRGALTYNEQKVSKGSADLLLASGFGCEVGDLTLLQKLHRFQSLIARNDAFKYNTLHISLNFPPEEQLSTELMQMLGRDYMERIGFGDQPFLIYRHSDAGHPHIHIVTTNIDAKGSPIKIHNIAKERSEPARKAIELEYGLIQAQSRPKQPMRVQNAFSLLPAEYSRSDTKHTISNIVREITRTFKYSNLDQLNAVLRQYNIVADRGPKDSQMYLNGGLIYSILDDQGFRVGEPIKASEIYEKPTLRFLQRRFLTGHVKKAGLLNSAKMKFEAAMAKSVGWGQFMNRLEKRGIRLHRVANGTPSPDLYLVDFFTKTAYGAEELGINLPDVFHKLNTRKSVRAKHGSSDPIRENSLANSDMAVFGPITPGDLLPAILGALLAPTVSSGAGSPEEARKRKKRKKRSQSH